MIEIKPTDWHVDVRLRLWPPLLLRFCALTAPILGRLLSSLLATSCNLLRIQRDMLAAQSFCTLLKGLPGAPSTFAALLLAPPFLPPPLSLPILPLPLLLPILPSPPFLPTPSLLVVVWSWTFLILSPLGRCGASGKDAAEWAGGSSPTRCWCLGQSAHLLGGSPAPPGWLGTGLDGWAATHGQAGRLELQQIGRAGRAGRSAAQLEALAAWQAEGHWASEKDVKALSRQSLRHDMQLSLRRLWHAG